MTATLMHEAPVAHRHHEPLMRDVDRIPATADLIGVAPPAQIRVALEQICSFLNGSLVPYMEAAEQAFYPELERLLQNRHSTAPLRREHAEIRRRIRVLDEIREKAAARPLGMTQQVSLRRALFGLYALLKVHLAEEYLYAEIVEHGATDEQEAALAATLDRAGASLPLRGSE